MAVNYDPKPNNRNMILAFAFIGLLAISLFMYSDRQEKKRLALEKDNFIHLLEEAKYSEAKVIYDSFRPSSFKEALTASIEEELNSVVRRYFQNEISYHSALDYLSQLAEHKLANEKNVQKSKEMIEEEENKRLVPYTGVIEHIFFHPLIAYPSLAFDNDRISKGYNQYFVTVSEFKKIIDSLYKNDFVLIDINSIWYEKVVGDKKTYAAKELLLPPGKKPLVISVDDLNYYEYMKQNGNVYRLVLDDNGDVATYSITPEGKELISYDNELIPILDEFVRLHPDFSFRGAKGIIALTGYEGILGYRTDLSESPDYEKEKKDALEVVRRLKETGWIFASHSYGHPNFAKVSLARVIADTAQWKMEVESLVGPTNIFIFPYGTHVFPGDPKISNLQEAGFNIFCYVGGLPYLKYGPDYVLMDRRHIDGIGLIQQGERLLKFFDSKEILDPVRPPLN